ncbi:helix-turn-helix domain-containing protein [Fructobacillus tropaeoli]|uniref:helix-turn-helix domain-containing protein n=1 Tax=Fructobacillus tropaeoli TaxID=709323 RepID=UPI001455F91D|nr:helix-turn-helix transcriptional regulator [Fructobacillus tropaeoli]NLS38124.1 helix-turn-helix domain-containing protein [Fructobacillus tropaeoli]
MAEYLASEVSQQLREARLEKGYTIDQLAEMTKIQPRFLQAIEDGDQDVLPGQFYARAFAKQFAEAVGLNPDDLLDEVQFDPQVTSDLSHAHRDEDGVVRAGVNNSEAFKSRFRGFIPRIWIAIIVVAILLVAWFVVTRASSGSNSSNGGNQVEVASSSVPQSSSSSVVSSSSANGGINLGTATTNTAQLTTTYTVGGQLANTHTIVAKGQNGGSMFKVTDGTGKVLYNAWLNQTDEKSVEIPANTAIVNIQVSQVSHVNLTINNQHIDLPNLPTNPAPTTWNVVLNLNK